LFEGCTRPFAVRALDLATIAEDAKPADAAAAR
jgi:hypothetical protein